MKVTVKHNGTSALAARAPRVADLLPGAASRRRCLEDRMLQTFTAWGYQLLETPAVELLSTRELGVEPERLRRLFKFSDGDGRMLAMVGERTVPVARVAGGQLRQAPLARRLSYLGPRFGGQPRPGSGACRERTSSAPRAPPPMPRWSRWPSPLSRPAGWPSSRSRSAMSGF